MWSRNCNPGHFYKKTKKLCLHRQRNFIHNSQKAESAQTSFHRWMVTRTVPLPSDRRVLSYENGQATNTHHKVDGPSEMRLGENTSPNGWHAVWLHVYNILDMVKLYNGERIRGCQETGRRQWGETGMPAKGWKQVFLRQWNGCVFNVSKSISWLWYSLQFYEVLPWEETE